MKLFMVLLVLLMAGGDRVQGNDVRLKLCGREFIRMVVTLCGSSRLKRDTELAIIRNPMRQVNIIEDQMDHSAPDHPTPFSLSSLSPKSSPMITNTLGDSESLVHRRRRDVGPAGVCCRSGCTKSELVQYC